MDFTNEEELNQRNVGKRKKTQELSYESENNEKDENSAKKPAIKNNDVFGAHAHNQNEGSGKNNITKNIFELMTQSQEKGQSIFTSNNKGPYGVWVRKVNKDDTELNAYKVGSIVFPRYKNIEQIKKRDRYRVEIFFKTREEASEFLRDKELVKENLQPFLPEHRVKRKAVVRGMDTDINVSEIFANCKAEAEVVDVIRITKKNRESKTEHDKRIATRSIIITFSGQVLPTEMYIFGVKTHLEPYVSMPMQCYNCFKFGHTATRCTLKYKACYQCGEEEKEGCCMGRRKCCVNCKEEHMSTSRECRVYDKQLRINTLMAYRGISFVEARNIIYPRAMDAPTNTKENFPELKQNKNVKYYNTIVKEYATQVDTLQQQKGKKLTSVGSWRKVNGDNRQQKEYEEVNWTSINAFESLSQEGLKDQENFVVPTKKGIEAKNSMIEKLETGMPKENNDKERSTSKTRRRNNKAKA